MGKLFQCDKCGVTRPDTKTMSLLLLVNDDGEQATFDLCMKCDKKFHEWLAKNDQKTN